MTSIYHLDNYTPAVSELTSRTIYTNESLNQYLISPAWQQETIIEVVNQWIARIEELPSVRRPPPSLRQAVLALGKCATREEFGAGLDIVLLTEFKDKLSSSSVGKTSQSFLTELMLSLWSTGNVAWPAKDHEPFANTVLMMGNIGWEGPQKTFLLKIRDYVNKGGSDDSANFRFILDHLLSRAGIIEIGDITPPTFYLTERKTRLRKLRSPGIMGVLQALRDCYPNDLIIWRAEDFGFFLRKNGGRTRDDDFCWLLDQDPDLGEWAKLAIEHLATTPGNFRKRRSALNIFMTYLLDHRSISRNPVGYFDIRKRPDELFDVPGNKGRQTMTVVSAFLDEVLIKTCSQINDNEIPLLMPGFANPLPKRVYKGVNNGETHRETMPTKLIRQAIKILTEHNFEWAKQAGRIKDAHRWQNPDNGKFETVWNPVRTYAILIKLLLPARTHQVRHLDSGEGDTYRYEASGQWVINQQQHRPLGHALVERGIFRKYKRKDGSEGAVLYFNTNKTADIDSQTKGFVMPWEKMDALKLFVEIRNWQEKYNPVNAPTAWTDIQELQNIKHKDDLVKLGHNFFIFRDPCNRHRPDLPVTDVRLRNLWLKLMEELERRLAAAGETLINGDPIKLILTRENGDGSPMSAVFDLHSLRVTLITAMYEEGIPPEILMKIVGHASVLMTLYYTKINAEVLTLRIDEALQARQHKAQSEMVGFIQKASRLELEQALAFRHHSALDVVDSNIGVGMVVMDHGLCPVAARRCHEGIVFTDFAAKMTKYLPVPGGATNCVRCRFFITGPAFLFGLEAHVGDLAYRLRKASYAFEKSIDRFDILSDQYAASLENGTPFHHQRALEIAETAFEASTAEVDAIALSLQSAYSLVEQCIKINNKPTSVEGLALVAVGGVGQIEAVLSESHEFEQLHRVCVNATFYDGLNINWQQPNLERARLFDRMLRASGQAPRFSLLDDEDALKIANAMGHFLYSRLDKDIVHALADGRTTLRAIGLENAFVTQLETLESRKLDINSVTKQLESIP